MESKRISLFTFRLWLLGSIKSTCRLCMAKRIQGMVEHVRQETTQLILSNKRAIIKRVFCRLRLLPLMTYKMQAKFQYRTRALKSWSILDHKEMNRATKSKIIKASKMKMPTMMTKVR